MVRRRSSRRRRAKRRARIFMTTVLLVVVTGLTAMVAYSLILRRNNSSQQDDFGIISGTQAAQRPQNSVNFADFVGGDVIENAESPSSFITDADTSGGGQDASFVNGEEQRVEQDTLLELENSLEEENAALNGAQDG